MKKIFFATGNDDKIREAREILAPLGIDVEPIKVDVPELQGEPEKVAEEKVKLAYQQVKAPVFVDDTALCFHALNGMPGIYIKHFLKAVGPDGLNNLLSAYKDKNATAKVCIGYSDGKEMKVFVGSCEGEIVPARHGPHGFVFGWDPIFQPKGYIDTFSTMKPEIKNEISHRTRALKLLAAYLTKQTPKRS